MYVCKHSAAPAHARTRAHRPAAPHQSSGVSQTPHPVSYSVLFARAPVLGLGLCFLVSVNTRCCIAHSAPWPRPFRFFCFCECEYARIGFSSNQSVYVVSLGYEAAVEASGLPRVWCYYWL